MNRPTSQASSTAEPLLPHPDFRPWYREPWPWVLMAIPFLTVVACGITLWLAISNPDYIVVDKPEYNAVKAELRAQDLSDDSQEQVPDDSDEEH